MAEPNLAESSTVRSDIGNGKTTHIGHYEWVCSEGCPCQTRSASNFTRIVMPASEALIECNVCDEVGGHLDNCPFAMTCEYRIGMTVCGSQAVVVLGVDDTPYCGEHWKVVSEP